MLPIYALREGTSPLLVSIPHNGSFIPPELEASMSPAGRTSADTDWYLDRLYNGHVLGPSSLLVANYSRYVVDLNRPADDAVMYPGQTNTGIVPKERFDGEAIYLPGQAPDAAAINERIAKFWKPYHAALSAELARLKGMFGHVTLLEAHSIRSRVPRFFNGQLPDFNVGTNDGRSCHPSLAEAAQDALSQLADYSLVVNGRFKGGYITRTYGQPREGIHAVQLELSQRTYLCEQTRQGEGAIAAWEEDVAAAVRPALRSLVATCQEWRP